MKLVFLHVLFIALTTPASASVIFSREAPGVQSTTVVGTTVETFNAQPTGTIGSFVSPVGLYTGGVIVAPDQFGGASQTNYISVGAQSGTYEYSVNFGALKTYFGFFWGAADAGNSVAFYDGVTLQAIFGLGDILSGLPSAYFGNPDTGQDTGEAFLYLNFTSTDLASRFDRVVFSNATLGSGFETDNHSTFDQIISPPGVPEPGTYATILSGGIGLICFFRNRKRHFAHIGMDR